MTNYGQNAHENKLAVEVKGVQKCSKNTDWSTFTGRLTGETGTITLTEEQKSCNNSQILDQLTYQPYQSVSIEADCVTVWTRGRDGFFYWQITTVTE